ncbi:MAG: hypothetical protein JXR75_10195 [Rhodobacteraceae bacterium]|nr:hypothetical protein [Paracoccaceae bacterium]
MTTFSKAEVEAALIDQLMALGYTCVNTAVSGINRSTAEPMANSKQMSEAVS